MSEYIFGRNAVLEALESERKVEKIYLLKGDLKGSVNKIIGKAKSKGILISEIDKYKLNDMADGVVHQGVCALVSNFDYSTLEDIIQSAREKKEDLFLVILDEIEDPHNFGAIIRSCEGAGVHGIIVSKRNQAPVTSVVEKSSAGAVNHMKIAKVSNISDTILKLQKENVWIYGACGEAKQNYTDMDFKGNIAIVIGNEGKGIGQLVKKRCDFLTKLPMMGKISSLNASNACAILVYEALRQRYGK
ncbi:MAG: 23S rRNA (guanosine(2251)-2'-O)-methyltransferase RlmB [Peptoniphilaceae bacterium]|uniref:23S rRNA (guanosine(2251)-2'-O)-methyltransferase RlmB n=1 Tax=Parvimonas sp. TaxID=1944660 RepID=UPI0025EE3E8E|nr:23S rRNA (guanosine(2251)-2'-O)-methyltransferase RlmB [Parvimonas sp.]MCI5996842.1 23S rRNA (guanosine(2251)-2'-O)-methyltransferase RlmB [Parvimonas sp.]MDD7764736.1 23S rRNA (guanosine(2251)-2'-O)-methyltransferase RlmB [Peptoniphilaceae bacterium]MDY3050794.1 23S rRNA (guanosine(2251)-2'-O)-methyltransferase RlmB [Parvimonas sp.]